jgi:hypothetical protein
MSGSTKNIYTKTSAQLMTNKELFLHHNDKTKGASTTSFEHRVGAAKCPME